MTFYPLLLGSPFGVSYSSLSTPLTPLVEIAFLTGENAGEGLYFTLDDPVKGVLDSSVYLYGNFDVYADVTGDTRQVKISRGRSQELDRVRAGQCQFTLRNHERKYDPVSVSVYAGNMRPRKDVRISLAGVRLFQGKVEDLGFTYDVNGDSNTTINAVDGFAQLAQQNMAGTSFAAELTGARITSALAAGDWPAAATDVDTGQATLAAGTVLPTDNLLDYLRQVELSEPGLLFMNRAGTLEFRDRSVTQSVPGLTFTDNAAGTGIPYTTIEVEYGTELLHNNIVVTFPGGTSTVSDQDSIDQYTRDSLDVGTLLSTSAQASDLANFLLTKYKQPVFRIRKLDVMVSAQTDGVQQALAAVELGDRVRVEFTPNSVPPEIVKDLTVDLIEHTLEPRSSVTVLHRMVLGLSETPTAFTLDVDTLDSSSPYGF